MRKIILYSLLSLCMNSFCFTQNVKGTKAPVKAPELKLRTKSGLLYKIVPGTSKTPLIKNGQIVKFNFVIRLNDSILYSSYGRLPGYVNVQPFKIPPHDMRELLPLMKMGDSAVTAQSADTLLKRGVQLPPIAKKGDRIITNLRVLKVFLTDSIARADYNKEMEKDRPRQMKEQEEQMAIMQKQMKEQQLKEEMEMQQSGEIPKELKEMEAYLATKGIGAQKTGRGTYVFIKQPGTGPAADSGKYVTVKYTGRILLTDSVFEDNSYTFQLGVGNVIQGWHEGIKLFKKGGEGTLYIPGFLAYGKNPRPGSPFGPFEALIFDIIITDVKDQP